MLIVSSDSDISSVSDIRNKKVAVNSFDSLSGHLLLGLSLGRAVYSSTTPVYTGGHLASIHKVRTGEVAAAAIDCVTYGLAEIHAPHLTRGTRVINHSQTFPALPYVISRDTPDNVVEQVQEVIKDAMEDTTLAWVSFFS